MFTDAANAVGIPSPEPTARIDQGDEIVISTTNPARQRLGWVALVAAFGLVVAIGVAFMWLVRPAADSPDRDVAGGGSAVNTEAPGPTFAPTDSPPLTVLAGAPLSYYAYLPDLHLAWRATTEGGTDICWKTPIGEGCQSDLFYAPDTVVVPNGSQVIILTRPDVGDTEPAAVTVEFSNGGRATHEVTNPPGIGIAYARVDVPQGATVVAATASK